MNMTMEPVVRSLSWEANNQLSDPINGGLVNLNMVALISTHYKSPSLLKDYFSGSKMRLLKWSSTVQQWQQ